RRRQCPRAAVPAVRHCGPAAGRQVRHRAQPPPRGPGGVAGGRVLPMNGRRVAIGLGVVAALGACGWWAVTAYMPQGWIDIDQAQLQARLDTVFPQKHCTMMVACVTLSRPVVRLTDGSPRIGLAADIVVALGHREIPGQVTFSGVLRYVRYQGDFFLDDVQVDKFALTGVSPDMVQ